MASRTDQGTPEPWLGLELWRLGVMEAMGLLGAQEAMVVLGTPEALVDRAPWPWPRHLAWPPRPGLYSPPQKKNTWGEPMGNRSPPGLSTGTGALPGLGSEAEALLGHDEGTTALLGLDVESGALSGVNSGTASVEATREPQQTRQAWIN